MLLMKIKNISKDPDNFTLGIPFFILPGLNADFDGDILNLIAMMNKDIQTRSSHCGSVVNRSH